MNIKSILMRLYFAVNEKTFQGKVKYLFQRNRSNTLAIVFSGFPGNEKPVYNYVKTLKNWKADKLFILDDFAYKGSYYWFQNGSNEPLKYVQLLINQIINGGGYNKIVTLGSSKGGTCAIYFGLTSKADDVYAAACQYYIGQYLNTDEHRRIFQSMMGADAGDAEQKILDSMMPDVLQANAGSRTQIHLMYSKEEHTYQEHISDLIKDLNKNGINHTDKIESFKEHGEVGKFFIPWIKDSLNIRP